MASDAVGKELCDSIAPILDEHDTALSKGDDAAWIGEFVAKNNVNKRIGSTTIEMALNRFTDVFFLIITPLITTRKLTNYL